MLALDKFKHKRAKKKKEKENPIRNFRLGLKGKLLLYFLLISLIPAAGLTIYSSTQMMTSFTEDRLTQLGAIGENKGSQITSWFSERQIEAYPC